MRGRGSAKTRIPARARFPKGGPSGRSALRQQEVADGIRTRDHRDHNPGLYQLSYRHRGAHRIARRGPAVGVAAARGAYPGQVVERKEEVMKVIARISLRLDAALS